MVSAGLYRLVLAARVQSTAMCGRYRLSRRAEVLASFYAEYEGLDWDARYNIAPTQNVPVINIKEPVRPAHGT
jgi:putative SOS response-associated peptidase YedK